MTDTVRINKRLARVPGFRGAQPASWVDMNKLQPGESVVLNYSTLAEPGTHWVAASRDKAGIVHWFDSFGKHFVSWVPLQGPTGRTSRWGWQPGPDAEDDELNRHTHFTEWLHSHNAPIDINTVDWQDQRDSTCGAWACAFVEHGPATAQAGRFWKDMLALKTPQERDRALIKAYGNMLDPEARKV